jgi:lysozyme
VDRLIEQLKQHEGYRKHVYKDSNGIDTIGYGYNLSSNMASFSSIELAYFYREGMSKTEALRVLKLCINKTSEELKLKFEWFDSLSKARQDVLINMCFNLGIVKLLKFKKMLKCLEDDDWQGAAGQMLESKWHSDVGQRAITLSAQMMRGEYANVQTAYPMA